MAPYRILYDVGKRDGAHRGYGGETVDDVDVAYVAGSMPSRRSRRNEGRSGRPSSRVSLRFLFSIAILTKLQAKKHKFCVPLHTQSPLLNNIKPKMELFRTTNGQCQGTSAALSFPRVSEPPHLTAADRIIADGPAEIILIGSPADIHAMAAELRLTNISKATIVDPRRRDSNRPLCAPSSTSCARARASPWTRHASPPPTPLSRLPYG